MTKFEPERLLEVLVDESVEFVLVGGYAAFLQGGSALERLNARIRTDAAPEGLPFSTSAEAMRGLLMLNLTTDYGDLDITFHPSGTDGYADLIKTAQERTLGTVTIRIAALADIVRSKAAAGRDKDIEALTELYQLLRRRA